MITRVWLDDVRKPPDSSWTWVKTVKDAIALCEQNAVTAMSLDYHLGGQPAEMGLTYDHSEPTGAVFAEWLAQRGFFPMHGIRIHSDNASGAATMMMALKDATCRVWWEPEWRTH